VLNRGGLGVHSPLDRLRKPVSGETGSVRLTEPVSLAPRRQGGGMEEKWLPDRELRSRLVCQPFRVRLSDRGVTLV